jgi:hypothetical protein
MTGTRAARAMGATARTSSYARGRGVTTFAGLVPNGLYGERASTAFLRAVAIPLSLEKLMTGTRAARAMGATARTSSDRSGPRISCGWSTMRAGAASRPLPGWCPMACMASARPPRSCARDRSRRRRGRAAIGDQNGVIGGLGVQPLRRRRDAPAQSIERVVDYARGRGVTTFAGLVPNGLYGERAST